MRPILRRVAIASPPGRSRGLDMVHLPGGTFRMGSNEFYPEEQPVRTVAVDGFWIDRHPVTNAAFAAFVDDTGYVTVAERPPRPDDYPGARPELLQPGGLVFHMPPGPVDLRDVTSWWSYVPGASWRSPYGPGSDIADRDDHPVAQVAYEDASAYATWRDAELPTEAEWEYAARGGLQGAPFCWGDAPYPDDQHMANTWQGEFPWQNLERDGYERTSPVKAFPANGFGLYDMTGNTWEWTTDWWELPALDAPACCTPTNPRGGTEAASFDPSAPDERFGRKVVKGGSHLCAPNYCFRFRPAARQPEAIDTAACHIGFRCIRRN